MTGGTLQALAEQYVISRVRMSDIVGVTAAGYRSTLAVLVAVHGERPVAALGPRTIERWKEARGHLRASTRRTQWSQVSVFLDWLVERGEIRRNPMRAMKAPKRPKVEPRTLEPSEVRALLAVAPDARARAIIHLERGVGARRIEVHRAKVEDWSRRRGEILLIGKGMKERVVPVPTAAARAFDAYLAEHPATNGPFFRSYMRPWVPLSVTSLTHYMARWMYDAGVKAAPNDGVSGHALRRTCASEILDETDDLLIVQEVLGHEDLSSTSKYLRRRKMAELRQAMEASWSGEDGLAS